MQRRSMLRLVLGSGVMAALIAAAPAQAAPASAPQPPAPGGAVSKPVSSAAPTTKGRQDAVVPVAQAVAAQARAQDSDIAGVEVDATSRVVHVYRTKTNRPLVGVEAPAGVTVVVHPAKFSRNAMTKAAEQVIRDAKSLGDARVAVQAVGPTVNGSGVTVTVLAEGNGTDTTRAAAVLHGRYGAIIANVSGVGRKTSGGDLFYSGWRFNDFAAWYGGDRIISAVGGCSTGFAAQYGGSPAMLTAAHCGGVGTTFSNGPRTDGSYSTMGTSVYSNSATDVAAIGVSSASSYINVGSALSPTQLYVGTWASPVVGQYLCQSGSYTGEVCGLKVVDTGQYVCTSWFWWGCGAFQGPLADVINAAGSGYYAAGHGDSGGPVYQYSGSGGQAIGLVHGVLTPNAQAAYPAYVSDQMWCPAPEGWQQRCASGFSFAHMPGY